MEDSFISRSHEAKPHAPRLVKTLTGHDFGWRKRLSGDVGVQCVAFSPDGQLLASGGADKTVRLWDLESGRTRNILKGHTSFINTVAFSPDGQILASGGSYDKKVQLWDPATGKCLHTIAAVDPPRNPTPDYYAWWVARGRVDAVAFSPDGRLLASVGNDSLVRLWELATRKCVRNLIGHTAPAWALAFSPDGQLLASGGGSTGAGLSDTMVRLWDLNRGEQRRIIPAATLSFAVTFSPDGRLLAVAGTNHTVQLWDPASGELQHTLSSHTGSYSVKAVAFSPNGRLLASSGRDDKTVRLWSPITGERRAVLGGHNGNAWAVAFSPDGQLLASTDDKAILLWDLTSTTS